MKMPKLKVGTRLDIIFENEINKDNAHYMKALAYDIEDSKVIISQTSPALSRHFLDRRIMVTFLANVEKRILRFGFPAKLIDLLSDYQIASNKKVEALVLKQYDDPELLDFRMYFRVKPLLQSDVSLEVNEKKVNLIDISLGGAKFNCFRDCTFNHDDKINLKLLIGRTEFNLDATVRDIWIPHDAAANKNHQYVSVEFEHDNKILETSLGRAIIGIERQRLSEGKI
jgi:hypothetical protein